LTIQTVDAAIESHSGHLQAANHAAPADASNTILSYTIKFLSITVWHYLLITSGCSVNEETISTNASKDHFSGSASICIHQQTSLLFWTNGHHVYIRSLKLIVD